MSMIEIIGNERTFGLVLSNVILMLIVYFCFKNAKKYPFIIFSKTNKLLGISSLFLFFLFAFWGNDWFHVAEFYPLLRAGDRTHMEDVYSWIAQNLAPNYLVFRTIIWGACLFLLKLIFDRFDIKKDLLWLMFSVFGAVWCSYARVSLAMCLMFYGLAVFFSPYKQKYLSYIIAITAISASYYFHKSALFGIIIVAFATIIRKVNRYTIILFVLSIPFIFVVLKNMVSELQFADADDINGTLSKSLTSAQGYMGRDAGVAGIGALLLKILERTAYILTGILALLMIVKDKKINCSPVINAFLRLDIFMVFISCLFLFDIGIETSIIAERFFRFLFIPTGILIAYFWQIRYRMRFTKISFVLAILYSSYALLYSLYMYR